MKSIKFWMAVIVIIPLLIGSCTPAQPTAVPPKAPAAPAVAAPPVAPAAPVATGKKYGGVLRVGTTDLNTLDVASVSQTKIDEFSMLFYEPLVERKEGGAIRPLLLKEWSLADDKVTHRWKLQEGVVFHNGEKFTAEVVKWNLERKIANKLPKYDLIPWAAQDPFKVIDELTMEVKLARPFLGFYEILGQGTFSMYSPKFVNEVGKDALKTQASGTGPFKVDKFTPNDSVTMVKNASYWQKGLPYLDGVQFKVVPDLNTRALMLESKDLDIIVNISSSEFVRLSKVAGVKTYKETSSSAFYGALDSFDGPLASKKVRQAVNYSINKEAMIQPFFDGMVTLNKSFVLTPTSIGYYANTPYPYDPAKAKALLEEDGWKLGADNVREKGGKKLVLKMLNRKGAYAGDTEVPDAMQATLAGVGIKLEIVIVDSPTFITSLNQAREKVPDYDIIYFSTSTSSGYARDTMKTIWRCDAWPPKYWNYGWYCNKEVDALIDEADKAATLDEANKLWAKAQQIVWDDAAAIFFFDAMTTVATRDYVEGLISYSSSSTWNSKYVSLNK